MNCDIAQYSDSMHCRTCLNTWDAGDVFPPRCPEDVYTQLSALIPGEVGIIRATGLEVLDVWWSDKGENMRKFMSISVTPIDGGAVRVSLHKHTDEPGAQGFWAALVLGTMLGFASLAFLLWAPF